MADLLYRSLRHVLADVGVFSERVVRRPLRRYQLDPARAIVQSVLRQQGLTFSVLMARQAGKNELIAHVEAYLLNLFQRRGGSIVQAAPTFKPQTINALLRLRQVLDNPLNQGHWQASHGYVIQLGNARVVFLSAAAEAQVVGATASLLLVLDEAQDLQQEKLDRDFRPMASSTNATTVLIGTPWDGESPLERQVRLNLDLERHDGVRRHFEADWQTVAAENPTYGEFVRAEIARLGADHPLIATQYLLRPIRSEVGLLSEAQLALVQGEHAELSGPRPGRQYVAGLDLAGAEEQSRSTLLQGAPPADRDSTVLTIAEVDWSTVSGRVREPTLRVARLYVWRGEKHPALYEQLIGLARLWRLSTLVVDATGIGEPAAGFLTAALGPRVVESFKFTAASKSDLAYTLLAAINGRRLQVHATPTEQTAELWHQLRAARQSVSSSPGRLLTFFVPESQGHDDLLTSLALTAQAATVTAHRRAQARPTPER